MSNILENVSLYQGNLKTDGSFSTSSSNYYQYYVRTDYIDITNYSSISIDVLTQGITVGYCALYDKNKKFIKYIDIETKLQQQCTCNKEDNVVYIVFDMGDHNLNKKITPSDVNINISFSELLYQGYIEKSGSLSSQTIYSDYHKASVRTDYIDITNYSSVSINIPTQNVTVGYYGLYDKDKKFIKYIDFSSEKLQQCTYNKEDEVSYIVFDVYRDGAEILLPSDVNINIDFSLSKVKNIKIGTSLIQRIYLGNIETSKVYLGNTLVFDVNS